jgi:hypothetical protein
MGEEQSGSCDGVGEDSGAMKAIGVLPRRHDLSFLSLQDHYGGVNIH